MQQASIDMVVVSREYGAGGSEFARALGQKLGWPVLDANLVERIAERLHLQAGAVQQSDEQAPGWLARIASTLLISPPESPMQIETSDVITADSIARAAEAEMIEAAKHPPIVIVGHGAQCIFRGRVGTMHVRLFGTLESRVPRIMARDGVNAGEAETLGRRINNQRQAYVQRYYRHDWSDPLLFDMQFNTGRVTVLDAVELVTAVISGRPPAGTGPVRAAAG